MFGNIMLRAKALHVIENVYGYKAAVPGFQNSTFGGCVRAAKEARGNGYDAAAIFMLAQLAMLADSPELDEKGLEFIGHHWMQTWAIFDRLTMTEQISGALDDLEPFAKR